MVRNNRAELDVPPETEQNVQQEYPQDQYPAEEYPQDTYEQDTYGQDDYLDDGNSYPDDMPISDYDIQEDVHWIKIQSNSIYVSGDKKTGYQCGDQFCCYIGKNR